MCLQEQWGGSCGLPRAGVTWFWRSGQRKSPKRRRRRQAPACGMHGGSWTFPRVRLGWSGWDRVKCQVIQWQVLGESWGGGDKSLSRGGCSSQQQQSRGQYCGNKGTNWSRHWTSWLQELDYNPQMRANQPAKMCSIADASVWGIVHGHDHPVCSPALEPWRGSGCSLWEPPMCHWAAQTNNCAAMPPRQQVLKPLLRMYAGFPTILLDQQPDGGSSYVTAWSQLWPLT